MSGFGNELVGIIDGAISEREDILEDAIIDALVGGGREMHDHSPGS